MGVMGSPLITLLTISFMPLAPSAYSMSSRPECLIAARTPISMSSSFAQTASISLYLDRKSCITVNASSLFQWAYCMSRTSMSEPSIRSEEHTSELQSRGHLVCRLLLDKKENAGNRKMGDLNYAKAP